MRRPLVIQAPKEFLLIHSILESLVTVNENYRDFIAELAAQLVV